jgi:hypothetical protein
MHDLQRSRRLFHFQCPIFLAYPIWIFLWWRNIILDGRNRWSYTSFWHLTCFETTLIILFLFLADVLFTFEADGSSMISLNTSGSIKSSVCWAVNDDGVPMVPPSTSQATAYRLVFHSVLALSLCIHRLSVYALTLLKCTYTGSECTRFFAMIK